MIKMINKKIILVFIMFFALNVNAQNGINELLDLRDSTIYKITTIGEQTWMAENLNFKTDKSWCYGNKAENCNTYGRLYSWDAAVNACPEGWHLPSDDEWKQMEKYLGMADADLNKYDKWRGTDQGKQLISSDLTGFNLLMGGFRNPNNLLKDIQAFIWTSSDQNGMAWYRQFYKDSPQIFRRTRPKYWAFSVRCIKD